MHQSSDAFGQQTDFWVSPTLTPLDTYAKLLGAKMAYLDHPKAPAVCFTSPLGPRNPLKVESTWGEWDRGIGEKETTDETRKDNRWDRVEPICFTNSLRKSVPALAQCMWYSET